MPRIQAENVAAHRELMWDRLLDAFAELLPTKGYADLTLADVAAKAGAARNTIYNYAPHKEVLLMAFIGRGVEQFVAELRTSVAQLDSAEERVEMLVARHMQAFLSEPGGGPDGGMLEGNALAPASHEDLQLRFAPLHGLIHEIVDYGIGSGEFRADLDVAAVVPMTAAVIGSERIPVDNHQHDPDEATAQVSAFLLSALT